MTRDREGRTGCNQATLKTSRHTRNFTGLAAEVKGFIVTLALRGQLPLVLADWLIQRGEPHDE